MFTRGHLRHLARVNPDGLCRLARFLGLTTEGRPTWTVAHAVWVKLGRP
jgi:hypothetical protein